MGFFRNLFGGKTEPVDLSVLKTDLHSHLLPGLDDGAKHIDDSLQMITTFYHLGYRKLITTPHVQTDIYKNTSKEILQSLDALRKAIATQGLDIQIEAAAEYFIDFDFQKNLKKERLLTFGDNYLLVEFSYYTPPNNLSEVLFQLQLKKYKIVLAHPERYAYWHNNLGNYVGLKDRGILFQMNINSLNGHYSMPVKKMAETLIKNNMVDFVGSDAHRIEHLELIRNNLNNPYLANLIDNDTLLNARL